MYKVVVFLSIIAVTLSQYASAELHRYVDENGRVIYTNKSIAGKKPDARKLQLNSYLNRSGASVIMYTTAWCPSCKAARRYLQRRGIPYREYDVETSDEGKRDYKKLGMRGVPTILVGGSRMVGFSSTNFERLYQKK
jgi:glutaredoxin